MDSSEMKKAAFRQLFEGIRRQVVCLSPLQLQKYKLFSEMQGKIAGEPWVSFSRVTLSALLHI